MGSAVVQSFTLTVNPPPKITVTTVKGSQTSGSAAPTFTGIYVAPTGVLVSGTLTCTKVTLGTTSITSTLPVGTYTISGAVLFRAHHQHR